MAAPVSIEVAACLGRSFTGGAGPRHTDISAVFERAGFSDVDPYNPAEGVPNKEARVRTVVEAVIRRPQRARELLDGLLSEMRASGSFEPGGINYDAVKVAALQRALSRIGWALTEAAELAPLGMIDVATGGRAALDDQLARLRRSTDDPALLLGTAKDFLESVAKFVLEELGLTYRPQADFAEVWYLARDRLGIHPKDVNVTTSGGPPMRLILQSAWAIADSVNELRRLQGTGHGRPFWLSAKLAAWPNTP